MQRIVTSLCVRYTIGMKQIPLSQGLFALVDDVDFDEFNQYKWSASKGHDTYYAIRVTTKDKKRTMHRLHRVIVQAPANSYVDHEDGNGLNCQRYNLRICDNSQNQGNSCSQKNSRSRYKGVSWHKQKNKWRAQICHQGKSYFLGLFTHEDDAAHAYDIKASELFGDFARLNIPT